MLKTYLIAAILGLLFALGFAPNDLWFISILSLTYLYFLIGESNKKELFLIGYSFGIGLWSLGISWLYVSIYFYGNIGYIASTFLIILFIGIISIYSGLTLFLYRLAIMCPYIGFFAYSLRLVYLVVRSAELECLYW